MRRRVSSLVRTQALLVLACCGLALAKPAMAQEQARPNVSSTYTDLTLAGCSLLKTREEGNYRRYKCAGLGGISIEVASFDSRMMVSYPVSACSAGPQTFVYFNEAGSKVEWRLRNGVPFATILRFSLSWDGAVSIARSWLVVSTIVGGESSPIAYIAGNLPNANTIAREAADTYAERDFKCGVDLPRIASPRAVSLGDLVMNSTCK